MNNRNVKNNKNTARRRQNSGGGRPRSNQGGRTAYENNRAQQHREMTGKTSRVRRRKKKSILPAILTVFAVIAVIAIVLVLFFVVFRVKDVQFSGKNSKYSSKQVIAAAGIELNSSYFGIDALQIKSNIEKTYPDIGEIVVEKKAPSKIVIKDIGYNGLIDLKTDDGHILLDQNGNVNRIIKSPINGITVVEGITLQSFDINKPAVFKVIEDGEKLSVVRTAIKQASLEKINKISFEADGDIILTYDNRIKLVLGNAGNVDEKLSRAKIIITEENDEKAKGTLDLSINGNAYFKSE